MHRHLEEAAAALLAEQLLPRLWKLRVRILATVGSK